MSDLEKFKRSESTSFRRRNPNLFGLGGLVTDKPQPTQRRTLEQEKQAAQSGASGVGKRLARIELIRCAKRMLDGDNLQMAFKPLRDAIANTLGIDDGSPVIDWEYSQCRTKGREGVIVRFEVL